VAVRDKDGKLQAPKSRKGYYTLAQWLKADGDSRKPKEASLGKGWQCDAYSCLAMVKGQLLSLTAKPDAIQEDCRRVAILITPMDIRAPCHAPKFIFDRGALWEKGSTAISISESGIAVAVASEGRGIRPWAPEHHRKAVILVGDALEKQDRTDAESQE
jgi:competence protein ComEC